MSFVAGSVAGALISGGVSYRIARLILQGQSSVVLQVYYGFSNLMQTRYVCPSSWISVEAHFVLGLPSIVASLSSMHVFALSSSNAPLPASTSSLNACPLHRPSCHLHPLRLHGSRTGPFLHLFSPGGTRNLLPHLLP